jgi:hypothetical protein
MQPDTIFCPAAASSTHIFLHPFFLIYKLIFFLPCRCIFNVSLLPSFFYFIHKLFFLPGSCIFNAYLLPSFFFYFICKFFYVSFFPARKLHRQRKSSPYIRIFPYFFDFFFVRSLHLSLKSGSSDQDSPKP